MRSSTGASYSTTVTQNGSTYVNYQDDDECIDDAFDTSVTANVTTAAHNSRLDSTSYAATRNATYTRCVALYGFQVSTTDICLPLAFWTAFKSVNLTQVDLKNGH